MSDSGQAPVNAEFFGHPGLRAHVEECVDPDWLRRHATWLPKNQVNVVAEVPGALLEYPRPVMVKLFGWRNTLSKVFSPVMRSRAKKSWDTAQWLLAHDITTPEPIAVFTRRRFRFIRENFYASRAIDEYQTARDILQDQSMHTDAKVQLVRHIADIVQDMHAGKLIHNDLTLANFLVKDFSRDQIYLVDLNRATHWWVLPRQKRLADVARMDLCSCDYSSETDHLCYRDIFLLRYSGEAYSENKRILRRMVRLRQRQHQLKRLRNLLRK